MSREISIRARQLERSECNSSQVGSTCTSLVAFASLRSLSFNLLFMDDWIAVTDHGTEMDWKMEHREVELPYTVDPVKGTVSG